jgi:AraC-like DNA-binding protein
MVLTFLISLSVVASFIGSIYLLILGLKSGTIASRLFAFFLFLFSATIVSVYTVTDPQNFIPITIQNLFSLLFYVLILAIPPTLYNFAVWHLNIDKAIHKKSYLTSVLLLAINVFAFVYLTFGKDFESYTVDLITEVMTYANFIAYLFVFPILTLYYFFLTTRLFKSGMHASHDPDQAKSYIRNTGGIVFGYGGFLLFFIALQIYGGDTLTAGVKIYLFCYSAYLMVQGYSLSYAQNHTHISKEVKEEEPIYFQEIAERLGQLMLVERPFLDSKLTLHQLAKMTETNEKYLSAFLNESYKQNFFSYINDHRIAHAKELLLDPGNEHFTLETIGNMSGFHSKSSFNSAFKKSTGLTPSEFKKNS